MFYFCGSTLSRDKKMLENKDTSKTDISKLGEFGLIEHLTKDFKIEQKTTIKGIGDDCAVLEYNEEFYQLISSATP